MGSLLIFLQEELPSNSALLIHRCHTKTFRFEASAVGIATSASTSPWPVEGAPESGDSGRAGSETWASVEKW